jgi:hypothetical protein
MLGLDLSQMQKMLKRIASSLERIATALEALVDKSEEG